MEIASYLLNEKRKAISDIEKRHEVQVVVVPTESMETPHFSVYRLRENEVMPTLSYDLAKRYQEREEETSFASPSYEEALVTRNEPVITVESVLQSSELNLSPAPTPPKEVKPSLLSRLIAKIKSFFAPEEKEPEKVQPKGKTRNQRERRQQRRERPNRNEQRQERKAESVQAEVVKAVSQAEPKKRREVVEEVVGITAPAVVERTPQRENNKVAERRQRRDLRKKVRVEAQESSEELSPTPVVEQTVEVPVADVQVVVQPQPTAVMPEVVAESEITNDNANSEERNEAREGSRQRRLPRHLRVGNQRRRERREEVKASMPLISAVASPELASGKIWVKFYEMPKGNVQEEKPRFLSVDEMLQQQGQDENTTVEKESTVPFGNFVVQGTNRDLVKENHERRGLADEDKAVAEENAPLGSVQPFGLVVSQATERDLVKENHARRKSVKAANTSTVKTEVAEADVSRVTVPLSIYQSSYRFEGKLGTVSRVAHTKSAMTVAAAPAEQIASITVTEWQNSKYYFYGKGFGGHTSAISHVYSAPRAASANR